MWGIVHPAKVFEYVTKSQHYPYIKALMLKSKFDNFPSYSKDNIFKHSNIKYVKIYDPNNPEKLMDSILIEYFFNN